MSGRGDNAAFHPNVKTEILSDLRRVRSDVDKETDRLHGTSLLDKDRGNRLFYLFQRDLMPVSDRIGFTFRQILQILNLARCLVT